MKKKKIIKKFEHRTGKDRIIQAAIECFCRYGVTETKLNQISELAQVDLPLIKYYYPKTDRLYQDVILFVLENLKVHVYQELSKNPSDPESTLKAYVRSHFEWLKAEPGLSSIWLYFYYLSSFHPLFKKINTDIRTAGRERITLLVLTGIEKKRFFLNNKNTPTEVAQHIQGLITGNAIIAGTEDGMDPIQMAEKTIKDILLIIQNEKIK